MNLAISQAHASANAAPRTIPFAFGSHQQLLDIPMILFRRLFHSRELLFRGLFSVHLFSHLSFPRFAASTPPTIDQQNPPFLMLLF